MSWVLLAAATLALVLAVSPPAPAQEEGGGLDSLPPVPGRVGPGYDPYGYPERPPPDGPDHCQYEPEGCSGPPQYSAPIIPEPGGPESAPNLGGEGPADAPALGAGPVEAAAGDPADAAALNGAIEAARADRAGRTAPVAASGAAVERAAVDRAVPVEEGAVPVEEVAAVEGDVTEDEAGGAAFGDAGGGAAIGMPADTSGAPPLMVLGAGSFLLLGAGFLLRRLVR